MKYFKKIFTLALLMIFSIQITHQVTEAAVNKTSTYSLTTNEQVKITYDSQGGYFVETLENSTPDISTRTTSTTKTKTKTVKYYNSNDVLCWSYSLKASFKINSGVSATYSSSSASADISKTIWSVAGESHSGSGNTATGTIKMKTSKTTVSRTITIKCDKNGNFS